MKVLDLFSGIGGFSLGLERAGMETVAFCEIDPFCRQVLRKHWPDVPIHEDIRELSADAIGPVDLICGGYPCQPFSSAGKRSGKNDDRYLWSEYLRLIREISPRWVIGENVFGHVSMGLDEVLSDLETESYTWETFVIPACAVDAIHRRDRVWIIAYPDSDRCNKRRECFSASWSDGVIGGFRWSFKPGVDRTDPWIPRRVDRLRALGNAVVPQIPEIIGRAIMAVE